MTGARKVCWRRAAVTGGEGLTGPQSLGECVDRDDAMPAGQR